MSKKYTTNFLEDTNGSTGSANQVLVSTAAGIGWVDGSGSGIIGGPYLPLAGGSSVGQAMTGTLYGPGATFYVSGNNSSNLKVGDGSFRMEMGRSSIQARVVSTNAASSLNLNPNGGDVLFPGSGNVGIGMTIPYGKLDVAGNIRLQSDNQIYFGGTGSIPYWTAGLDNTTNNNFVIGGVSYYSGDRDILLTPVNNGNVGIGTDSPLEKLHVSSGGGANGDCVLLIEADTDNTVETSNAILRLRQDGGAITGALSLTANNEMTLYNEQTGKLFLGVGNSTKMTIDNSGNVGIGITSVGAKLDVSGTVRASAFGVEENTSSRIFAPGGGSFNGSGTQTGYLIVQLPNNGSSGVNNMMTGVIRVYDYTTNQSFDVNFSGYWYSGYNWTNCSAWIDSAPNADINFTVRFGRDTATGTRPVITIGDSNSTWSYLKFNVISFTAGHSNTQLSKWDDGWSCSLSSTLPMTTSVTNSNLQVNNWKRNGQDVYYSSGTGNVGINTTSPNQKLHVNGGTQLGDINATVNFGTVALKVVEGTVSTGPTLGSGTVGAQAVLYSNGAFGMYTGVSSNGDTWMQSQRNDAATSVYNILLNPLGGKVGVGTTNPGALLEVYGSSPNILINNTAETDSGIVFTDAQAGTGQRAAIKFSSSDNKLKFFVNDEVDQRMVIDTVGALGLNNYTSTSYKSGVTPINPIQNFYPSSGAGSDTTTDLGVDQDGNVVKTTQEATWNLTDTQVDNITTGTTGTTLLSAPGAGLLLVVEKVTFMIKFTYDGQPSGMSTTQKYEIRQATNGSTGEVAVMNGGKVNDIACQGDPTGAGIYEHDTGYSSLNRTYYPNKATVIRRTESSSLPPNVTGMSIKMRYRVYDPSTF